MDDASYDKPQNYHQDSTPRAGGLGILAGLVLLILSPLGLKFLLPVILAFVSGIFEDFHHSLSPKLRLSLQIVAALSAIWLTNSVVTYLGLGISMPYWMGIFFSTFAIVGMMNAVNMIDGFNGLASGIVLLILFSFGIVASRIGNEAILYLSLITGSSLLGFFVLNFPKGKIFLGDGGAYLLGFIAALAGIFLASNYEKVSPWFILSVLIYPVWEVLFSIYRRYIKKLSPMEPDAYHLHTLIYKHITHNNPLTGLFIVIGYAPFALIPTLYAYHSGGNLLSILLFIICYTLLYRYLYKKEFMI